MHQIPISYSSDGLQIEVLCTCEDQYPWSPSLDITPKGQHITKPPPLSWVLKSNYPLSPPIVISNVQRINKPRQANTVVVNDGEASQDPPLANQVIGQTAARPRLSLHAPIDCEQRQKATRGHLCKPHGLMVYIRHWNSGSARRVVELWRHVCKA